MGFKSDIEIAQEATPLHIQEIAKTPVLMKSI